MTTTTYILILRTGACSEFSTFADLVNAFRTEYGYYPLQANVQDETTLYYQGIN